MEPLTKGIKEYDTATFYSISNCQEGLAKVTLGNFLIKMVVEEIQQEMPNIKNFGTLSPIPGFVSWFSSLDDNLIQSILGKTKSDDLSFLKSPILKHGDMRIESNQVAITKLVGHYLVNEKNYRGFPINDVCRFHLGNGAIIDDIIVNANISDAGFSSSFGFMVNYLYELENIEKNHEDYVNNKKIIYSKKINKFIS
jgi:malonyl-CoA decarboxylase